ncbi:sulfur carrier protein ThiS [Desulfosarcina ovata]|nr:sulfur carrier protein ThiS [Desulfosarcina ovata]
MPVVKFWDGAEMITVDDRPMPWHAGMCVADLLAGLPDGHLYAVVKMDGRLIGRPRFAGTQVPDGARIDLIPMIAGG